MKKKKSKLELAQEQAQAVIVKTNEDVYKRQVCESAMIRIDSFRYVLLVIVYGMLFYFAKRNIELFILTEGCQTFYQQDFINIVKPFALSNPAHDLKVTLIFGIKICLDQAFQNIPGLL